VVVFPPEVDHAGQNVETRLACQFKLGHYRICCFVKDNIPSRGPEIRMVPTAEINSTAELFWNYDFPLETKRRLNAIREAVADAFPISQDDWEDGFRKDAAPEREIALWEHVAKFYTYFANKRLPSIAARQELLTYLFACAGGYDAGRVAQKDLKHIATDLAETIQGCYIFDSFSLDDPVNYPPDESEAGS
jgi:hypothetical protein